MLRLKNRTHDWNEHWNPLSNLSRPPLKNGEAIFSKECRLRCTRKFAPNFQLIFHEINIFLYQRLIQGWFQKHYDLHKRCRVLLLVRKNLNIWHVSVIFTDDNRRPWLPMCLHADEIWWPVRESRGEYIGGLTYVTSIFNQQTSSD